MIGIVSLATFLRNSKYFTWIQFLKKIYIVLNPSLKNQEMIIENPQKNSRIYIFFAGLTFILPLTLIYSYNYFFDSVKISGVELKKN